jgi:uncharacterized protein (TIGR00297 family)
LIYASLTMAAAVLGCTVTLSLGAAGFLLLLTFFALSVITDKIKERHNKTGQNEKTKHETRTAMQVVANGGLPFLAAVLYALTAERVFVFIYVATLAEALSDTASSSLGSLSRRTYDLFRLRRCTSGESGGMSLVGTLTAAIFALLIPSLALPFDLVGVSEALLISLVAFSGSIIDSLLGSLVQGKFICTICEKMTESKEHCGLATKHYRGCRLVDNSAVNLLSALATAILTAIVIVP